MSDELRRIFSAAANGEKPEPSKAEQKDCPWCLDLMVEVNIIDGTKRMLPACADNCNCEDDCGNPVCEYGDYDD